MFCCFSESRLEGTNHLMANPVEEIHRSTLSEKFIHFPSEENPPDVQTGGLSIRVLAEEYN